MSYSRKAINFDLSTEALKRHFGENTAPAYNSVKQFMLANGFEHRQYSGYASIEPMDEYDISNLTRKLAKKFAWLSSCVQKFDVTDIGEQYSLMHILKEDINPSPTTDLSSSKEFTQKQINDMREQAKKASKNIKPKDDKDKGRDLDR
ncbi:VapD family protein [Campylobacter helveticus]|uniref:VapD family protein n=1 Tax=Campylobacter helveticus TaxID=28898 RepID=UPI0022EAF990|nr:VapD family protein [Campylobacter helveticus]